MQPARSFVCSVLGVAILACAGDAATTVCTPFADEPIIENRGPSRWQRDGRTLRFTELWRAGGTNENEELIFPITVAVAPDGRVAIADFQLAEVVVVNADGAWQGAWTRSGRGPGETGAPLGAAWDRDGNVIVYDIGRSRLLRLAGPASLVDETEVPVAFGGPVFASGELQWTTTAGDGTVLLEPVIQPLPDGSPRAITRVLRWAPGGNAIDTLVADTLPALPESGGRIALPGAARPIVAVDGTGAWALGGTDARYRITRFDAEDRPLATLCRDAPALPLTALETGDDAPPGAPAGPETERRMAALRAAPRPEPAPFGRFFLATDGTLWVQRERAGPLDSYDRYFGVAGAHYDVFAADGTWLGEVASPPGARVVAATADRAYAFVEGDAGEIWLVAYQIEPATR